MASRPRGRGRGFRVGVPILVAAAVVAAILGVHTMVQRRGGGGKPTTFDSMKITSLTGSGKVRTAAISPDGKVVVQAVEEKGKQSLWIRQVATASDVEIVPHGPPFRGLTFSPDGNYVYYTRSERDLELYSLLYQVPVFGGPPRKLIFDIDTQITLSPDGKQLAFVRGYPAEGESAVMVASADGTGERKLAVRKRPDQFELTGAAWSPDGETIVAVASSLEGGSHRSLVGVDVGSGEQRRIGAQRWARIEGLAWLPDQSGIVIAGVMDASNLVQQIWLVSHPDGQVRRVTNDLNSYSSVSLTHDSRSLITVRTNAVSNLWVVPVDGGSSPLQLTSGRQEFIDEVRWSRAGPIAFRAFRNDTRDLWLSDPDGSSSTQLTSGLPLDGEPVLADDGNFVLCTSSRQGGVPHVWKLDPDGSNATRVTDGAGEVLADVSPDGSWFLYRSLGPEGGLWKMSVGGGDARGIVEQGREFALLSRDGRHMAYARLVREGNRFTSTLAIIPAEGGEVIASLVAEEGVGESRWGPSNDMISYVLTRDGVANIWAQPIHGGPAKQITRFDSRLIFSFDWSPDKKQLAVSRGEVLGDVVMLSDFR
jgi:Tol biopolymer transport system component